MTQKQYTLSLNGIPDHEHIIFKLICSVSERTKNRTQSYIINADKNTSSDIYINDIKNKSSLDETAALPLNVWISNKQEQSENVISRPLIATRVLNTFDKLVENCKTDSNADLQTEPENIQEEQANYEATAINFDISEEEASELAIVHDEILENPANQNSQEIINDPVTKNPELTLINGNPAASTNLKNKNAAHQVLVVDDSPSVRKQLEIELEFFDVSVDFAESAESAFNLLNSKKYDLALLDVVLPDKDGFQICKHIKAEDKSTIAVMLTGKATQADKIKGSLAGCNAYMVKPVGRQTFQNTIKNYLPFKQTKEAVKA